MRLWENGWNNYLYLVGSKSIDTALEGKGDWEFGHKKTDLCWLWSSPSGSLETLYPFEEVLWWVELFKAALGDCSTVTGMNYPFTNFVPRKHLFLFGALLGIDFDSHLSYQKKRERKLPINFFFVLVESNIAFQTRFFPPSNGAKYTRWEKPGIENLILLNFITFFYISISAQSLSSIVNFLSILAGASMFCCCQVPLNSSQTELN